MSWFPPPLRWSLPGLLLAAGLAAQGLVLTDELDDAADGVETRMTLTARIIGTILSAEIETAYRNRREMVARNLIMHAGADPDLEYAALLDHQRGVIFSSDLRGDRDPTDLGVGLVADVVNNPRQAAGPDIRVDRASGRVIAAFPVPLEGASTDRRGVLFMSYDTRAPFAAARQRAIAGALVQGIIILAIVLAIYLALRWLLLGRLRQLARSAKDIADGDYGTRAAISGRDEIASLGQSFNAMAEQVESRAEALRAQAQEQRYLLDNLDEAVLGLDSEGRIREANRAAVEIFGQPPEALSGACLHELVDSEDGARLRTHLDELASTLEGGRTTISASLTPAAADTRQLEISVFHPGQQTSPREFVATAQDVTYRRRMEQKLRRKEKMEAIGNLAGGIAHDFNNVLQVIALSTQALHKQEQLSGDGRELLDEAIEASQRAADLTHQLLVFARRSVTTGRSAELNQAVADMARMLSRLVPDDVVLEVTPCDEPLWVAMDRTNLEQIVANLVINARDATAGIGGGRIEVITRPGEGAPPAARIVVSDNGSGMTDEIRQRIFEPFFTSKASADQGGTGLGLATVYELVRQHGGEIDVDTAPGSGATFTVTLPIASDQPDAAPEPTSARETAAPPPSEQTVLLVEDQVQVLKVLVRTLQAAGFQVLTAGSAEEAIAEFDAQHDRISAVITDIGLPGMDGLALRDALLERRPELPILLTSGYADNADTRRRIEDEEIPLLAKPFMPKDVLEALRALT